MSTHHASAFSVADRTALLTINEVGRLLKVSRWTVYKLVRAGDLHAVKVGERLRFRVSDVERYLDREPAP
jgi:putative molybdopterin biosynthesis protein